MRYYLVPPKEEADEDNVEGGDGEEDDADEEEGDDADEHHQAVDKDIPTIVAGDESSRIQPAAGDKDEGDVLASKA